MRPLMFFIYCMAFLLTDTVLAIPDSLRFATTFSSVARQLNSISLGNCSLKNIYLPLNDTKKRLPTPSPGLNLKFIALGRGAQNYTCTSSNALREHSEEDKPVAVGAVATLFDASCIASTSLNLLHELPAVIGRAPLGPVALITEFLGEITNSPSLILGEHYFNAAGEPTFNLTMGGLDAWIISKKNAAVTAPARVARNACPEKGRDVAWLKLDKKQGEDVKEVYRVVTFQGSAPSTCAGQKERFQVDYAAEYWFYG
ncbi:hypothetical protein PDE_08382 [Penicillium oxalicum 114-2]|uniref:Malate dehydrogenase n=1 Tax=Penicillium oxalicum (strain 114-2 / CGMCC 5302) TaxID=933388 RepID=S7ZRR4_PENO1|nr:hypothetical protein PDE_08382 [Penicillium oxalicum 114-2]